MRRTRFLLRCAVRIGLALMGATHIEAQSSPAFNAASIKQHKGYTAADFRIPTFFPGGRFSSTAPLDMVIAAAWNIPYHSGARFSKAPAWVFSDDGVYDIEATAGQNTGTQQMRMMLQKLLADRLHLVVHREAREMPVYVITVAKGGPKLERADMEEKDCATATDCHVILGGRGRGLHARAADPWPTPLKALQTVR